MDRRGFLALSGAGLSLFAAGPGWARGSRACYEAGGGSVRCATGFVKTPDMVQHACRTQSWAVCLAYILRGYGAELSDQSVLDASGAPTSCGPDDGRHRDDAALLYSANGHWRDDRGRSFLVRVGTLGVLTASNPSRGDLQAVTERLSRQPVLCGAGGHTTLMTEIKTVDGPRNALNIEAITVRDPWLGRDNLRNLAPEEMADPFTVLAVTVRVL